ncbi:MAG TPA: amidase family protein, partial [Phycisphaerales bacterium]|nr:amidase family protein [Phycisphaerales bacterium]
MSILIAALALSLPAPPLPPTAADVLDIRERTIAEMGKDLDAGRITSVELVDLYLERIERLDRGQAGLHSILIVNPRARNMAKAMDSERALGHTRGPLHGIPIVVKDNIEVMGPMPTTAGSLALQHNITNRDAGVIERLRRAGVVVLGKTNLSEWANIRSNTSSSGWSAVGGLTVNPYDHTRSACGSSSGTGAAVSSNFAAAGLGTETDGSVTCPAAMNGLVGLKPTVGL